MPFRSRIALKLLSTSYMCLLNGCLNEVTLTCLYAEKLSKAHKQFLNILISDLGKFGINNNNVGTRHRFVKRLEKQLKNSKKIFFFPVLEIENLFINFIKKEVCLRKVCNSAST